ncbi:mRNA cap guanine-N7 methyltransferase 1 [Raphanus sativus]|nr:mRNA cap guanine-N7 methyltransferase 1 [Raphanus sativus]
MKRGFSQSPSTTTPPPSSRFKSNPQGSNRFLLQEYDEEESTKKFARKVADHYSRRTNQTLEDREASPIIHLKKLNNWIKSVLIQLYARPDDAVLDLACGKGGDLITLDKARIGYYVGIDIAEGSIVECVIMVTQTITNVSSFKHTSSCLDTCVFKTTNVVVADKFAADANNKVCLSLLLEMS